MNHEFRLACALCDYVKVQYPAVVRDMGWFAVPNGEYRNKVTAGKLKRTGVLPGVPDYLLSRPSGQYKQLWLEIKHEVGKVNHEQKAFLLNHNSDWEMTLVGYGYTENKYIIDTWMKGAAHELEWMRDCPGKRARNKGWKERASNATEESAMRG